MKKVIFFILGAAITFIVVSFAMVNVSGNATIIVSIGSALFGGLIGSSLAKRAKNGESKGGLGKIIIWILVILIIVIAVIAFVGLNK